MNIAHPFMEGNGRTTRIWLDMMLRRTLRKVIDWRKISREVYMQAMERSPINDLELRYLLQNAMTTETDDRDVVSHGLEQSYYYKAMSPNDVEIVFKTKS